MDQLIPVKKLTECFINTWAGCPADFTISNGEVKPSDKKSREKVFEKFIESLNKWGNKKEKNSGTAEKLTPNARLLFKTVFGYPDEQLEIILSEDYKNTTREFIRMSRQFDPQMSLDDIFQACRNAWIMNGIQVMFGQPVKLTPSIFAYSMLYPYTDNYLDNPKVAPEVKIEFGNRFRNKLGGGNVNPANIYETKIFKLVEQIEIQYDRAKFPHVYASLLAIQDAQLRSLLLLKPGAVLSESEALEICIEKGGTSVLADGYLVAGGLTEGQSLFLYGFGAFLQMVDDIQDVNEDTSAGLRTVFSQASPTRGLDALTSRTFSFGDKVFELIHAFPGDKTGIFKALIKKSVEIMLTETILLNTQYYSADYICNMEAFSPLSISYLQKRRSKLSPQRISYMKKIIESVVDDL